MTSPRAYPRGRIGTTEDMAGTAIYLASRAGDYVVGTRSRWMAACLWQARARRLRVMWFELRHRPRRKLSVMPRLDGASSTPRFSF
jgi:hypothetical protein